MTEQDTRTATALETILDAMSHKCRVVHDDDTCFMGTGAQLADALLSALAAAGYTIAGPGQVVMHIDEDEWTRQTADDAATIAQQRAEILALVRIVVMLRDIVSRERSAIEPIIARYRAESETTR